MFRCTSSSIVSLAVPLLMALCVPPPASAADSDRPPEIVLGVDGDHLSVHLDDAPLRRVIEKLSAQKGLWFKIEPALLDRKISVTFSDAGLETALKRIFSGMNHSLFYDAERKVIGAVVVPEGGSTAQSDDHILFAPPGQKIAITPEEAAMFRVERDVPPPGGEFTVTPEEKALFRVRKNVPPPGHEETGGTPE